MKQSPLPVDELLQRFKNNACTPEEMELLQQWVTQLNMPGDNSEWSPEQLNAMKARMYRQIMAGTPVVITQRGKMIRRYLVAAGWLALVASAVVLWYIARKPVVGSHQARQLLTIIENNSKGIKQVTLPDGTRVYLNRNSRLEFDQQQYNRQQRFVQLSGEGFFEVVRNTAHPFIVETGHLHTRVLGTAFNIEAYNQESEIRVSLVHGKIALDDTVTAQTTLLSPDQTYCYSKQTNTWQVRPVTAANVILWTKGWLVFNEVPLREALERIKEKYNLVIEGDAQLLTNKRITATFQTGPWQPVLENILFVHGLRYRQAGDRVIIERN